MKSKRLADIATIVALVVTVGSAAMAQTINDHSASWFGEPGRTFFLRLDGSGNQMLVNRSTVGGGEELVQVPTAGGESRVWYSSSKPEIFNRIAVNGAGTTIAFAKGADSHVLVLRSPGAVPSIVSDVAPYRDPRQLAMSRDGAWVAFTAAGVEGGGPIGRSQVNLYVAATDGSATHQITNTPLAGRYIAFAFSADGSTMVWVDDPAKGPIVANRDGTGRSRLLAPGAMIQNVFSAPDGSRVYCTTGDAAGTKLQSIARQGASSWILDAQASAGIFTVVSEGSAIRLVEMAGGAPGTCWSVDGSSGQSAMFTFEGPQYAGSITFSGDGNVVVWREGLKTRVWQAGQ